MLLQGYLIYKLYIYIYIGIQPVHHMQKILFQYFLRGKYS